MTGFLLTSDIHLTSRSRDEYRWLIFDWLRVQALSRDVTNIFVLGDITDQKDHHANLLINRIVDSFDALAAATSATVWLMKGNHDYIDPEYPLLKFLGGEGAVRFVSKVQKEIIDDQRVLFLPHQMKVLGARNKHVWHEYDFNDYDFIFLHQTMDGSVASNGFPLPGLQHKLFEGTQATVIAGDIHVPQKIGPVTYCGSPHPVRFGDDFKPRVLWWNGTEVKSVSRVALKKAVIILEDPEDLVEKAGLDRGDQVKVIITLAREDFHTWEDRKRKVSAICEATGLLLYGVELKEKREIDPRIKIGSRPAPKKATVPELFESFCDSHQVDREMRRVGRTLL